MMNHKKSVFYVSLAFSLALISFGAFIPDKLKLSNSALSFIYNNLGWFILGSVLSFSASVCFLVFQIWSHTPWR